MTTTTPIATERHHATQRVTIKRAMRLKGHTPRGNGLDLGGVYSIVCEACGRQGMRYQGHNEGSALAVDCDARAKGKSGAAAAISRAMGTQAGDDQAEVA